MGNAGYGVGSFAGGFAKGLSGVLTRNQQNKREDEKEARARQDRYNQAILPTLIDSVEDPADLEPFLTQMYPEAFAKPKGGRTKAGEPTAMDHVKNVLSMFKPHLLPGGGGRPNPMGGPAGGGTTIESGFPGGDVVMRPDGAGVFTMPSGAGEQTSTGQPGAPPPAAPTPTVGETPQRRTLLGVPVLSRSDKAKRDARLAVELTEEQINGKRALAQRLLDTGAVKTIQQAWTMVGLPVQKPIELSDRERLVDPDTHEVLVGADPNATTGDYNVQRFMGVLPGEPRSKARPFVFDPRTKQTFEQDGKGGWTPVTTTVEQVPDAPQTSVIVTPDWQGVLDRNTRVARPAVDDQGNPIAPRPTAAAQDKEAARGTTVKSVGAIKSLGDSIITKIGPAQRADAAKRGVSAVFGNDPNFRAYQDARLALAGNLAVLQQGSRPSDADIKAIWLPLVPDVFSDTKESAAIKWRLIQVSSGLDPAGIEAAGKEFQASGRAGGGPGGVTPTTSGRGGGAPNQGAAATRLKVRQYLMSKGKQADEAAINVFLGNEQNANFIKGWTPPAQ